LLFLRRRNCLADPLHAEQDGDSLPAIVGVGSSLGFAVSGRGRRGVGRTCGAAEEQDDPAADEDAREVMSRTRRCRSSVSEDAQCGGPRPVSSAASRSSAAGFIPTNAESIGRAARRYLDRGGRDVRTRGGGPGGGPGGHEAGSRSASGDHPRRRSGSRNRSASARAPRNHVPRSALAHLRG
jgi:hypothetical protein